MHIQADRLCLYGIPDESLLNQLKQWLKKDRKRSVVILEEDEGAVFRFPKEDRMNVVCVGADHTDLLKKLAWEGVFLSSHFLEKPGNSGKSEQAMREIFSTIIEKQTEVSLFASDYSERGLNLLKNLLFNLKSLSTVRPARGLFGKMVGIPAVIVGGGPSLAANKSLVSTLKNKALILSGGRALQDVTPHLAAAIDPHPTALKAPNCPFVFPARVSNQLLGKVKGEKLMIESSDNLPLEEWIERAINLYQEPFDGGWTVSTFLCQLALQMGCSPIILIGVDLSSPSPSPELQQKIEIEGRTYYTKSDFLFAAKWLSELSRLNPQVEWINASQTGLPLSGFKTSDLLDLPDRPEILQQLSAAIEDLPKLPINQAIHAEIKTSFQIVSTLCSKLLKELEKHFPRPPEESAQVALLEVEIEEQIAYQTFLKPVWDVWQHVFKREVPIDPNLPKGYGLELHKLLFMKELCQI